MTRPAAQRGVGGQLLAHKLCQRFVAQALVGRVSNGVHGAERRGAGGGKVCVQGACAVEAGEDEQVGHGGGVRNDLHQR